MTKPTYIAVQRGAALVDVVRLPEEGALTIGRSSSNLVVVPDVKCSREHAELRFKNGGWQLRDLHSRNGVFFDGVRLVAEQALELGQSFSIGDHTLTLTESASPGAKVESPSSSEVFSTAGGPNFEIIERKTATKYDGPSQGLQFAQDRDDHAADLFRIARVMASQVSIPDVCRQIVELLREHCRASFGGILLFPEGRISLEEAVGDLSSLHMVIAIGDKPAADFSTYMTRSALREQSAILARDISQHVGLASNQSLHALKAESAICSPIRHNGKVLGVIHLYSTSTQTRMSQGDLEFVLAVSDQLGDHIYSLRERADLESGLEVALQHVNELQDQLEVQTELIGQSPSLGRLRSAIAKVAPTDALVLIRGESGVGKELVARALHFNSLRKNGPFVCVNCAALTESLLESELFGHERGAFTGANARRAGKFEQANGGTLFLDEIGEMSPDIQAKFLRILEGQPFERVGGGSPVSVDVRVVTATNRDLEEAVRNKSLRKDLFFRLQVIEVTVPPLREHPEDIPAIAQHFLARFSAQAHRRISGFTLAAIHKLQSHSWPGNVRELRNVVERAVILAEGEYLGPQDVELTKLNLEYDQSVISHSPYGLSPPSNSSNNGQAVMENHVIPAEDIWATYIRQNATLDDMDRLYIEAVLKSTFWNKSKASRILQIERTTLDRRLKKYGLARPGGEDDDSIESLTSDHLENSQN